MHISLCLWHLVQVPHTNPKSVSISKFLGLSILPFQLARFLRRPKHQKSKPQTCLVFKTVRLELCRKPIRKPSQLSPNRATFSPKRNHFVPKTEPVFPKNGACSPQKRSMFFPNTEHVSPKNGASQSRCLISPKPVADFRWRISKVGDRFPQNRWRISPNSVTDFP